MGIDAIAMNRTHNEKRLMNDRILHDQIEVCEKIGVESMIQVEEVVVIESGDVLADHHVVGFFKNLSRTFWNISV